MKTNKKNWHISISKYIESDNVVEEYRVEDFEIYDKAIEHLKNHSDQPIYLHHTQSASLPNPNMAIVETHKYRQEWNKIVY